MRRFGFLLVVAVLCGCSWDSRNLLTTGKGTHLVNLEIRDSASTVVWKITAREAVRQVDRVEYGEIPDGYQQEFPVGNLAPRPLKSGESLMLIIVTTKSTLEQEADAVGPKEIAPGGYTMTERRR